MVCVRDEWFITSSESKGVAWVGGWEGAPTPDRAISVILIILSRISTEIDVTITPTVAVKAQIL